jgi:hypothetical protein
VALIVAGLLLFSMLGCASGRSADGRTVVGFQVGAELGSGVQDAAAAAGGAIGGIFGGPAGAIVGGSIASGIVGLFAAKKHADARAAEARSDGLETGWRERADHQTAIDTAYDAGRIDAASAAPSPYAVNLADSGFRARSVGRGLGGDVDRAGASVGSAS